MSAHASPRTARDVERFLAALVSGDQAGAVAIARAAVGRGLPYVYDEVVYAALVRIGELWQEGALTVADEHVATAIAQTAMSSLYTDLAWPPGGPRAIVACAEGERHEVGARMVADLLALDGWRALYLGADVPAEALVDKVAREAPALVAISATLGDQLPAAREAIRRLRRGAPGVKVLAGGQAVSSLTDPAALGADAVAPTASAAVEVARRWKP